MTTANITDRSGAINMVEYGCNVKKSIPSPEKSGRWRLYQTKFADTIRGILRTEVEVVKRNELYTFSVFQKRWLVKRTFGWLDKYRRL